MQWSLFPLRIINQAINFTRVLTGRENPDAGTEIEIKSSALKKKKQLTCHL